MNPVPRTLIGPALAAALVLAAPPAQALLVEASVAETGGGVFHYSFSITNNDPHDYVIVSLVDAPLGDPLIAGSFAIPVGFLASYDGGLGFVDFFEDTELFAAGTVAGPFELDSLYDPSVHFRSFEALTTLGELVAGEVAITRVPVPEPGSLALLALGFALLVVRARGAGLAGQP